MNKAAAVGVRQADLHLVALDRRECVEEVIDVEADLDFLALVADFDLVLSFLLLRIVRLKSEQVGTRHEADAAVLLVGKDGRALECLAQCLTISLHDTRRSVRDNTAVLRETTIDQLQSEANVAYL